MKVKRCQNCKYFQQHFTFNDRKIFRVHCGHCTFQRAKRTAPGKKACADYEPGSIPEDAFVSKEFLSKALLQYMFNLDLLPKIEETE